MTNDLKWSEYDFSKVPFDDLVRVGQRTMLYRDMFSVSCCQDVFVTINARTVGLMLGVIEKIIDRLNYV